MGKDSRFRKSRKGRNQVDRLFTCLCDGGHVQKLCLGTLFRCRCVLPLSSCLLGLTPSLLLSDDLLDVLPLQGRTLHLHLEELLARELRLTLGWRGRGGGAGAGDAGDIVVEGVAKEEVVVGEESGRTTLVLTVERAAARPRGKGAWSVV